MTTNKGVHPSKRPVSCSQESSVAYSSLSRDRTLWNSPPFILAGAYILSIIIKILYLMSLGILWIKRKQNAVSQNRHRRKFKTVFFWGGGLFVCLFCEALLLTSSCFFQTNEQRKAVPFHRITEVQVILPGTSFKRLKGSLGMITLTSFITIPAQINRIGQNTVLAWPSLLRIKLPKAPKAASC